MEIKNLMRSGEKVHSYLKEIKDQLITTKGCKVYFPKRYEAKGLAEMGNTSLVLGIVAFVVDDQYYATMSVITRVPFTADEVNIVNIEDVPYYELVFRPGSVVIPNMNCLKTDVLCYSVYDLFISKGEIPWYMNYDDLSGLFETTQKYTGATISDRPEILAMCTSLIARNPADLTQYYRQVLDQKGIEKPEWVAMKSVEFGATNTVNKLGGSYMQVGIVSSLIDPATRQENIESILRE